MDQKRIKKLEELNIRDLVRTIVNCDPRVDKEFAEQTIQQMIPEFKHDIFIPQRDFMLTEFRGIHERIFVHEDKTSEKLKSIDGRVITVFGHESLADTYGLPFAANKLRIDMPSFLGGLNLMETDGKFDPEIAERLRRFTVTPYNRDVLERNRKHDGEVRTYTTEERYTFGRVLNTYFALAPNFYLPDGPGRSKDGVMQNSLGSSMFRMLISLPEIIAKLKPHLDSTTMDALHEIAREPMFTTIETISHSKLCEFHNRTLDSLDDVREKAFRETSNCSLFDFYYALQKANDETKDLQFLTYIRYSGLEALPRDIPKAEIPQLIESRIKHLRESRIYLGIELVSYAILSERSVSKCFNELKDKHPDILLGYEGKVVPAKDAEYGEVNTEGRQQLLRNGVLMTHHNKGITEYYANKIRWLFDE